MFDNQFSKRLLTMTNEDQRVKYLLDLGECLLMATEDSFAKHFFNCYSEALKVNPKVTKTEVFEKLNNIYFGILGEYRYSDYDSFRRRHKSIRKNITHNKKEYQEIKICHINI